MIVTASDMFYPPTYFEMAPNGLRVSEVCPKCKFGSRRTQFAEPDTRLLGDVIFYFFSPDSNCFTLFSYSSLVILPSIKAVLFSAITFNSLNFWLSSSTP